MAYDSNVTKLIAYYQHIRLTILEQILLHGFNFVCDIGTNLNFYMFQVIKMPNIRPNKPLLMPKAF